jgi:predicted tellurium resistance membrane protein TerC
MADLFADFFTVQNLITLMILIALETVLGFDNVLYITIEAKRVAPERQKYVRQVGLVLAIALRIVLLFVVLQLIAAFQDVFLKLESLPVSAAVNGHSVIVLLGGVFLIYTALKEIFHMMQVEHLSQEGDASRATRSVATALAWILAMNIVFSFDTVLSAVALTDHFLVMAIAIAVAGVLMVALAEHVARFLERNRMYEVLGLFVLLLVGVMLMSEGGHIMHLAFFGYAIEPLEKSTFYFVVVTLVIVDFIQGRYQRKLDAARARHSPLA